MIAGQSNASGRGTSAQLWANTTLIPKSFNNAYTITVLVDPSDSSAGQVDAVSIDVAAAGSVWPLVADDIMNNEGVVPLFVPCAMGGTSITDWLPGADHEDRTTLYGSMVYRAKQAWTYGAQKCVLWHLGESDALAGMTRATYNGHLDTLANAVVADLGVPLVAAKIHKWDEAPAPTQAAVDEINDGIDDAWGDNVNVLQGPDFDNPARVTDLLHFTTDAELLDAAGRWWVQIEALFY